MANLSSILTDQNYVNANPATKKAIFDKFSAQDPNYLNANPDTQNAIRERFGVSQFSFQTDAGQNIGMDISYPSAAPQLPPSLQPRVAPANEVPGPRQDLSMGQTIYQNVRPYVAPTIEALGAGGGALLGGAAGTVFGPIGTASGAVAGGGLGYGIAKELLEVGDVAMGIKAPRQGAAQVVEPVRNILEGSTFEAGGRVAGPLISKGVGKLMDLRKIPQNKAANIARNALGPDLPEVLNALKAAKGQNVSAAQAAADINSPTFQALIDRATARDPRFLSALEKSQGDVSLNALSKLAGGRTAADVRATTEGAKTAVRTITSPMREAALNRADLGKEVARLEGLSAELGEQAAAKVQEVRRLMELGDIATANARLGLIKQGLPVGLSKFTYSGELAEKAFNEWSNAAAQASLDLGQGARFADEAAGALRSVGIKPLESAPLISTLKTMATKPEFAGNDVLLGAMRNVADDVAKWTSSGGVIDARALDAIRKNSVNAAIQQLRPGIDATTQRNLAAGVLSRVKPVIDDAIEAAGGKGYREYLKQHAEMSQKIAEKQLTGEALRLFKTDKNAFVQLVQNESPDVVEKILGPGKYNIAVELAENTMNTLENEATKIIRNANIKSQVEGGQTALQELMIQNMRKLRLPSYLSAVAATTNKGLNILENKIGAKTMATLTEALKTPQGAANLLESLPAAERSRVLQLISDPSILTQGSKMYASPGRVTKGQQAKEAAELIRSMTVPTGVNMLAPERNVENDFVR
jgi:outer membrane lipoprotein SlyB